MNAVVDDERCKGCGQCETLCPAVFTLDGNTATVGATWIPAESETSCRRAAQTCPAGAIFTGQAQAFMRAGTSESSPRWMAL